jgi:predicted neutral ceramidase superfamily lipid hydrolase
MTAQMRRTTIKYEPYKKRHLLPGALPFVIGTLLYLTALAPVLPKTFRLPSLVLVFVLMVGSTIGFSWLGATLQRTQIDRWRLVLPPTLLVSGAFLFHMLVGTPLARFVIVTAVMLLLFGYLMRLDSLKETADQSSSEVLRFARLTTMVGVFFLSVFVFAIRQFTNVSTALIAILLLLVLVAVSYDALMQAKDIDDDLRRLTALAVGVLAAELYVGLSFLPTAYLVNAAVLVLGYFACLRAAIRILHGDLGTKELRLGLWAALILIVVLLATARWA